MKSRNATLGGRLSMNKAASPTSSDRSPSRLATLRSVSASSVIPQFVEDRPRSKGSDADVVGDELTAKAMNKRILGMLEGL